MKLLNVNQLFRSIEEGRWRDSLLLRPFSALFAAGAYLRNWCYDRKLFTSQRLPLFVVSVGNIVAGGVGKTPFVHLLAQMLQTRCRVGIVSRGYRAQESGLALGDEMTMLSQKLPSVWCNVGKDRVALGKEAAALGVELLIVDDGFQYRKIHRDFDFVVIDAKNPWGYGAHLPRGLLREAPQSLQRADALIVNGLVSPELERELRRWSGAPIIGVAYRLARAIEIETKQEKALSEMRVGAFCAIAHPQRMIQTLKDAGAEIVDHAFLLDHRRFDEDFLRTFGKRCAQKGARYLVCSEKDAVKLSSTSVLPICRLEMSMEIVSGQKEWQEMIERMDLKR